MVDLGYSRGSFADYLAEQGWWCVGVDLLEHRHPRIKMVQCDLNEGLPFASDWADAITAGEIIEHLIDQEGFLEECHRVLRKGGSLVITTPNLSFSLNRLRVLLGQTPMFVYAPYHYHFHTVKTIRQLMERAGFKVVKVASSHILYSRRRHFTGVVFEWLGDVFPALGAHLILFARKISQSEEELAYERNPST